MQKIRDYVGGIGQLGQYHLQALRYFRLVYTVWAKAILLWEGFISEIIDTNASIAAPSLSENRPLDWTESPTHPTLLPLPPLLKNLHTTLVYSLYKKLYFYYLSLLKYLLKSKLG